MDNNKRYNFLKNTYLKSSDSFYRNDGLDYRGWYKLFPFKLMFKTVNDGNYSTPISKDLPVVEYVLPIPPQELNITLPFANILQPTLTGIVEQTNGAPFRDIMLSGVTGVNIIKNSAHSVQPSPMGSATGQLGGLFGGAINAAENAIFNVQNIANFADGNSIVNGPYTENPVDDKNVYFKSTGFYQIEALKTFLEKYAEIKKANKQYDSFHSSDLRLIFANFKDGSFYVVSGVSFNIKRSANDPLMYNYNINLRAYRRIAPENLVSSMSLPRIQFTPNIIAQGVFKINSALNLLENASQGISTLTGDIGNNIRQIGKTANVFLKNAGGIAFAIKDFPSSVQRNIVQEAQKMSGTLNNNFNSLMNRVKASSGTPTNINSSTSSLTGNSIYDINQLQDNLLSDFYLSKDIQSMLRKFVFENSKKSKKDFDVSRADLQTYSTQLATISGAVPQSYTDTYGGVATPAQTLSEPTASALWALNDLIQQMDSMSARSLPRASEALPRSIDYIAGLATSTGIAFTAPVSKFAVPFPYGSSLERLAVQYLGDANRWHEIAALNGLSSPYVDEDGWKKVLVTNGDKNNVYISDKEHVYKNQIVYLVSNTVPRIKRKVLNIVKLGATYQVTLDGEPNLDIFAITDQARLEGFLPNTVNSQKAIYIPSQVSIEDVGIFNSIPTVDQYDPLIQAAGADLLLDESGDLIVTESGDTKLAVGIQNIIQMVKAALEIEKGSLIQHPEFGLGIRVGSSLADIDIEALKNAAQGLFSENEVFSGVQSVDIQQSGPYIRLTIVVGIKGLGSQIPITFNLSP